MIDRSLGDFRRTFALLGERLTVLRRDGLAVANHWPPRLSDSSVRKGVIGIVDALLEADRLAWALYDDQGSLSEELKSSLGKPLAGKLAKNTAAFLKHLHDAGFGGDGTCVGDEDEDEHLARLAEAMPERDDPLAGWIGSFRQGLAGWNNDETIRAVHDDALVFRNVLYVTFSDLSPANVLLAISEKGDAKLGGYLEKHPELDVDHGSPLDAPDDAADEPIDPLRKRLIELHGRYRNDLDRIHQATVGNADLLNEALRWKVGADASLVFVDAVNQLADRLRYDEWQFFDRLDSGELGFEGDPSEPILRLVELAGALRLAHSHTSMWSNEEKFKLNAIARATNGLHIHATDLYGKAKQWRANPASANYPRQSSEAKLIAEPAKAEQPPAADTAREGGAKTPKAGSGGRQKSSRGKWARLLDVWFAFAELEDDPDKNEVVKDYNSRFKGKGESTPKPATRKILNDELGRVERGERVHECEHVEVRRRNRRQNSPVT